MNKRIVAKWLNTTIWGAQGGNIYRHVFMIEDFTWLAVDTIDYRAGFVVKGFSRDFLIASDKNWAHILEKIDNGAPPDWVAVDFKCSCGVWSTMGKTWALHSPTCNFKIGPPKTKNNDGRTHCYICGSPTKQAGGGAYMVCKNSSCEWYNN